MSYTETSTPTNIVIFLFLFKQMIFFFLVEIQALHKRSITKALSEDRSLHALLLNIEQGSTGW